MIEYQFLQAFQNWDHAEIECKKLENYDIDFLLEEATEEQGITFASANEYNWLVLKVRTDHFEDAQKIMEGKIPKSMLNEDELFLRNKLKRKSFRRFVLGGFFSIICGFFMVFGIPSGPSTTIIIAPFFISSVVGSLYALSIYMANK